jgi:nucleoside-diphosphate-sugar epimerase
MWVSGAGDSHQASRMSRDSDGPLLILGAGYIGAALADRALAAGGRVVLADNWYATERGQLASLEREGAVVETADIRSGADLERLLDTRPSRVYLLAAQASRPLSEREPDYTEETNVTGARRVGEAIAQADGPPLVFASSLHVYGSDLRGKVGPEQAYGGQTDLAHLSKIYAEQCLCMQARRSGFDLAVLRLGIVYGESPVMHERPESQTVVDKFLRLAADGRPLPLDDGGQATIGVAHVDDVARILLEAPARAGVSVANVAAETVTVADVAAMASGRKGEGAPAFELETPFNYHWKISEYMAGRVGARASNGRT